MSEASKAFRVEKDGPVTTVFLAAPERRNALGPDAWAEMPGVFEGVDRDPDCRAVVLAAEGKHFTVGLDLTAMGGILGVEGSEARKRLAILEEIRRLQSCINAIDRVRKPVIAAVHGYCLGGGIDMITACDIRLASRDAVFSVRETRMAIVADIGTLQRLPGIVGRGHAAELVYTGKDIDAARAAEIGLVNHVHDDAEAVLEAARAMAREIAGLSPLAVQGSKQVMAFSRARQVQEGLDYVAAWNSAFLISDDLGEAVGAFLEKRDPRFSGS